MRAFTLVEILVSLLIFCVISAAVYAVLTVGSSSYLTDLGLMRLEQEARRAMQPIVKDLRSASLIDPVEVIDTNSDKITFNNYSGSGISYYRDTTDANHNGIISELIRQSLVNGAQVMAVVAGNITRLKFNYANHIVTTEIGTAQTVRGKALSYSLKSRVRVRNEK